jgi:tripartite-type tricarboxylate transporter receptor subunit TctC
MNRRPFLLRCVAAAALVTAWHASPAVAQDYPIRPVRLINGFAPGGAVDALSRTVGELLAKNLAQPVVIENRPGAAGAIAAEAVARSTADGYTLGVLDVGALAVNPVLQTKLPYNPDKDFAFVGPLARVPLVLVVHPSLEAKTLPALVSKLRSAPGQLSYGSAGIGSPLHLAMEAFKKASNTFVVHIPYRGAAPAVQDVLAGRVAMMFIDYNTAIAHLRSGALVAVAAGTATRMPALPAVPTFAESGYPTVQAMPWLGLVAPAATPPNVVARAASALRTVMGGNEARSRIEQLGFVPMLGQGDDLAALVRDDGNATRILVRDLKISLD